MVLPRAARARGEVVLEVRVGAARVLDALEGGLRERRPAEVRVHDHAGRVQHPPQRGPAGGPQLTLDPRCEVARIVAGADLLPRPGDHGPGGVDRERIVHGACELVDRGQIAQLHGMQITPRIRQPAETVASLLEMKRGVVLIGVVLVAAAGAAVVRTLQFHGAAKPGVHVLGIDVGGKSRAQIEHRLLTWARRPVTIRAAGAPITFGAAGSS